ncbi:hypothetical protein NPIL_188051 [Nephila pilipes]|uniref:Uncharacterized protein n=1 Tax=Nephila pilipes TaxID=299642 RepID=A0A8X6Q699_NEPPI|nr:hypothetical protein NPIL_188051 [Nephila pilipes]
MSLWATAVNSRQKAQVQRNFQHTVDELGRFDRLCRIEAREIGDSSRFIALFYESLPSWGSILRLLLSKITLSFTSWWSTIVTSGTIRVNNMSRKLKFYIS